MIIVERYTPAMEREWNDFVSTSRNATFLHDRRYMDYHADRFADYSLVARDAHGVLLAVLPACRAGVVVTSHAGLTYGGWLMPERRCDALDMLEIWDAMTDLLRAAGVSTLIYKPVPHIYHRRPAEEDIYAMARAGGQLDSCLVSSVIDLDDPIPTDRGARRHVNRVMNDPGVTLGESTSWEDFYGVLSRLLAERYDARPVHTLDELMLLRNRFERHIRLYAATDTATGEMLAGTVLYVTDRVARCQYIAASPRGKDLSVMPALFQYVINEYRGVVRYLDMGSSNEDDWHEVNAGLLRQKCSYGGRAIAFPTFRIEL